MVLLATWPKKTPEKGHSHPVPKRWRCDLLGIRSTLWTWQGGWPQPLTETICSAAAKGNWNCKALPVFTLFPGLQLTTRDRDCPFDQQRRGRTFFFQTGVSLQSPMQRGQPHMLLGQAHQHLKASNSWNDTKMFFFLFTNILKITFFPVDTWKREWLGSSLSLKNPLKNLNRGF